MQFSTIYARVESLANVTNQRALIKDAIQTALYRATARDLPYLMTDAFIATVAPYETSTITATNGSTTITGASTVFTAAMVGRKIRIGSETAYYRISAFVSATEVTLEVAYQGTGGSGLTYSIYKDEYRLPADLDHYKVLRQIENGLALTDIENTAFDLLDPAPRGKGSPEYSILAGTKLDTYSTGTVSATVNTSLITGSSTAWSTLEGFGRGSKITIGSNVYTVQTVDSATQVTIYELIVSTVSAGTAYSISLDNYIIQFKPIPDSAENIYFKYQRLPFPLVDDQDIPDLPEQYHHILISGGLIWAWEVKDKAESKIYESLFKSQVFEMWEKIGYISAVRSRPRWSQDDMISQQPRGLQLPAGYGFPIK